MEPDSFAPPPPPPGNKKMSIYCQKVSVGGRGDPMAPAKTNTDRGILRLLYSYGLAQLSLQEDRNPRRSCQEAWP